MFKILLWNKYDGTAKGTTVKDVAKKTYAHMYAPRESALKEVLALLLAI